MSSKIGKILFNTESKTAWKLLSYDRHTDKYLCECINISKNNLLNFKIGTLKEMEAIYVEPYNSWILLDNSESLKVLYGA